MEQPPESTNILCACPSCGRRYRVEAARAGRMAKCGRCHTSFMVEALLAGGGEAGTPERVASHTGTSGRVCAVCQSPIEAGDQIRECPACKAPYHPDCWEYNKGCGVYGCPEAPPTENLGTLEIPVSFWGREEKDCPMCGRTILAAATRCRHCGATFQSARPETSADFQDRSSIEGKLPAVRRASVWMLIFSAISCTAPIMAVVAPLWYVSHRKEIQALPALQAAVSRIAVGLAVLQTAMIVLFAVLYAAFGR